MLLYITAEDVFGSGTPERRGPRPLHTIPETLAGLVDLGLRHHVRAAAMAGGRTGLSSSCPTGSWIAWPSGSRSSAASGSGSSPVSESS